MAQSHEILDSSCLISPVFSRLNKQAHFCMSRFKIMRWEWPKFLMPDAWFQVNFYDSRLSQFQINTESNQTKMIRWNQINSIPSFELSEIFKKSISNLIFNKDCSYKLIFNKDSNMHLAELYPHEYRRYSLLLMETQQFHKNQTQSCQCFVANRSRHPSDCRELQPHDVWFDQQFGDLVHGHPSKCDKMNWFQQTEWRRVSKNIKGNGIIFPSTETLNRSNAKSNIV